MRPAPDDIRTAARTLDLLRDASPPHRFEHWFDWLLPQFGIARQRDWPLAPLVYHDAGGRPGDAYWLLAEPVTLVVSRDDVGLAAENPVITLDEATAIVTTLNAHFAQDGIWFDTKRPEQWVLRVDGATGITTVPPDVARNRPIRKYLPKGCDAQVWQRWQSEIQMLLFDHPLNERREREQRAPVNSLWLWGGGSAPAHAASPFQVIVADDAVGRALATWTGARLSSLPASTEPFSDGIEAPMLIIAPSMRVGEAGAYIDAWLAPLCRALARGALTALDVVLTAHGSGILLSLRHRSWWRRLERPPKRLAAAITAAAEAVGENA